MKKRLKGLCIFLMIAVLAFAYRYRFIVVNQAFNDAPLKSFRIGEEVPLGKDILMDYTMEGYFVTVKTAEVMTCEEFIKKYHGGDEYTYLPDKVYELSVTIRNADADTSTGINLNNFYIQGLAVSAGIDTNLYEVANPKLEGVTSIALRNNSEMEFHLPFGLYEEHFRKKIWNHLDDFEMNFVATLYPVKKVVGL